MTLVISQSQTLKIQIARFVSINWLKSKDLQFTTMEDQ